MLYTNLSARTVQPHLELTSTGRPTFAHQSGYFCNRDTFLESLEVGGRPTHRQRQPYVEPSLGCTADLKAQLPYTVSVA
jgi:hypothetical protein